MALKTKMSGKHRSSTKKSKQNGPDDPPKKKYSVAEYKRDSTNLDKAIKTFTKYHKNPDMYLENEKKTMRDIAGKKEFQDMFNKRNPKK